MEGWRQTSFYITTVGKRFRSGVPKLFSLWAKTGNLKRPVGQHHGDLLTVGVCARRIAIVDGCGGALSLTGGVRRIAIIAGGWMVRGGGNQRWRLKRLRHVFWVKPRATLNQFVGRILGMSALGDIMSPLDVIVFCHMYIKTNWLPACPRQPLVVLFVFRCYHCLWEVSAVLFVSWICPGHHLLLTAQKCVKSTRANLKAF